MPKTTTTTRNDPSTRLANSLVLVAGLWLLASWRFYAGDGIALDGERHVYVGVLAGSWLAMLAGYQLLAGAGHTTSVLIVWTGLLVAAMPVVLRYGYLDRIEIAYVNHIVTGLVVMAAGVWSAKRTTPAA